MKFGISFFLNSILLGVGLAMDAFSVSLANGLCEPNMRKKKVLGTAGIFGIFQAIMPLIGWFLVSTVAHHFQVFQKFIPWIAFILLGYIGGKMIVEGIRAKGSEECGIPVTLGGLTVQGIATSIDALSVGFTISDYNFVEALVASLLIGVVTFAICVVGLRLGKRAGNKLSGRANILGGVILLFIGLEFFIKCF